MKMQQQIYEKSFNLASVLIKLLKNEKFSQVMIFTLAGIGNFFALNQGKQSLSLLECARSHLLCLKYGFPPRWNLLEVCTKSPHGAQKRDLKSGSSD